MTRLLKMSVFYDKIMQNHRTTDGRPYDAHIDNRKRGESYGKQQRTI